MADEKTTLPDPERTRHRLELLSQAYRGLLTVHGGAIVALLAFIQAVQKDNQPQARIALWTILPLVLGLVLAIVFMALRYHTSYADQSGNPKWRRWRTSSFACFYGSVGLFAAAMLYLVFASLCINA
jgi:NhaP-type Na+/H+ or K+/H+ antiporter